MGYDYNSLEDPTSDSDGDADYLMKPWESWIFEERKRNWIGNYW